ncbi:MAG: twin-arginine translocase TatA/TatE family subunit [Campylobacterales bacterium]|nr:twin-arginine translocase TatA/TatE family subunit [Campylobacterales bacterium]
MGMPGGQELLIILLIVVLLFGAKKIPELAKGIGKGIKNFKDEMKDADGAENVAADATKKVESTEDKKPAEATKTTTQA